VDFNMILDEIRAVAKQETDLNTEAANAIEFARNAERNPYAECPRIFDAYDTVLVMEYIEGIPIDHTRELLAAGLNLNDIAEKLASHYIRQIVEDGFFHADPHPGNIIVRGGKIVWIDLGMMGRISARDKELVFGAISAVYGSDTGKLTDCVIKMCSCGDSVDRAALGADLEKLLRKYSLMDFEALDIKELSDDFLTLLTTHRIRVPKNVSMLIRGVLTMQGTIRLLNPRLNLVDNISSYLKNDYFRTFLSGKKMQKAIVSLYHDFREALLLPSRMSETMQELTRGGVKTYREVGLSRQTLSRIEKIVNRLVVAWVFGVLFIGSSVIFACDIPPRAWGVPVIGALGYAVSFLIGIWLIVSAVSKKK